MVDRLAVIIALNLIFHLRQCYARKDSRIECWIKETNSLNTKIKDLERSILLEENRSKNWYNKLVKAEELKESYKKECSIKDSRIEELKKMYKEECSIKDSTLVVLVPSPLSSPLLFSPL